MKTIQIPTNSNPFIVSINNHVYQYRAGETAEVPDEVAAAIEDVLELEPRTNKIASNKVDLRIDVGYNTVLCDIPISDLLKRMNNDGYDCVNIKLYSLGQPYMYYRISGSFPDWVRVHYMYRSTKDEKPSVAFEHATVNAAGTLTIAGDATFISG